MRLGQFARKYDIRVQDLISYLESDTKEEIHSNTKLSDKVESDILDFFGIEPEEPSVIEEEHDIIQETEVIEVEKEVSAEKEESSSQQESEWDAKDSKYSVQIEKTSKLPETPLEDIISVEGEVLEPSEQATEEPPFEKPVEEEKAHKEDEVIQTDQLLEMLESEESPKDLEKIKLIKAYKKELAGLKVLGKVDLPEPKKKPEANPEEEKENSNQRRSRPQLSEEEREKRRLRAKQKQEAYEARQEKRRKEQEAQKLKDLKAFHYKQKLEKVEPKNEKKKVKKTSTQEEHIPINRPEVKPEPKTLLGKWWRWMNT